ncbi:MAG: hypothetical protein MI865_00190 [Proteobacteria bacterium]|nr:hypothetical protein [Pseudomonadota bacterium]
MIKIFGFRFTPFFLFILSLECLALLVSIYLGILLYKGEVFSVSDALVDRTFTIAIFLVVLLMILMPVFNIQLEIIHKVKKSVYEYLPGVVVSLSIMSLIVLSNLEKLDAKMLFLSAVLSACAGSIINNFGLIGRYWRLLVRAGVN